MSVVLAAQQVARVVRLLRSGGLAGWLVLSLGVLLTLWGLFNLFSVQNRLVLLLQTFCSLIPAVIASAVVYGVYLEFSRVAMETETPRPAEFAVLISAGLMAGMIGPLATVIPAALGIAARARVSAGPELSDTSTTEVP